MANRAQVVKIQMLRRQVPALRDEETYHAMLESVTGKTSSNDLDNDEVSAVVAHLVTKGAVDTTVRRPRRRDPKGIVTPDQQAEIDTNYQTLTSLTGGYDTFAKRTGFNRRCCKKAIPQTRADAIKVIQGQKAIIERERAKAAVDAPLFVVETSADRLVEKK